MKEGKTSHKKTNVKKVNRMDEKTVKSELHRLKEVEGTGISVYHKQVKDRAEELGIKE